MQEGVLGKSSFAGEQEGQSRDASSELQTPERAGRQLLAEAGQARIARNNIYLLLTRSSRAEERSADALLERDRAWVLFPRSRTSGTGLEHPWGSCSGGCGSAAPVSPPLSLVQGWKFTAKLAPGNRPVIKAASRDRLNTEGLSDIPVPRLEIFRCGKGGGRKEMGKKK